MSRPCWCETEEVTLYVKILNVSEGGVFIRTATPLEVGRRAKVVFHCPGGNEEVVAVGEVIRSVGDRPGPPGMGLRFVSFEKNGDRFLDLLRMTPPPGAIVS